MINKLCAITVTLFICNPIHSKSIYPLPTDSIFEYSFTLPKDTYHQYCRDIYSQNGEDGILEKLFEELEITNGTFCEFGASDGIASSNTYNLIKNYNFSGVAIESDTSRYWQCVENYRFFPNVQVFHGAVLYNDKAQDLNAWLKRGNLPHDLDLISIDIDGDDYYVWENLTEFDPKVVIFEVNSYRDPIYEELPGQPSREYNIDLLREWQPGRVASGCSFISAVQLGLKKGYIPVSFTGNLTFVRKDLIHKLKDFPYQISEDPYDYLTLYTHLTQRRNQWYTNTGLILGVAIRDYYLKFKTKYINVDWLEDRMSQIINGG